MTNETTAIKGNFPLSGITDALVHRLDKLSFSEPTTHVYNPLVYARQAWDAYCEKYGRRRREVLFIGMNPGPFGMAQCGVPFGEIAAVRDWLGIETPIGTPPVQHPKRPVLGFACPRSEVSGRRLWSWAQARFGTPEAFFERHFITNYCPLVFMESSGRNRIPEKLPKAERTPLFAACDQALSQTIDFFRPRYIIGIGKFAEKRARAVAGDRPDVTIGSAPHPSPASPAANRGWAPLMDSALVKLGVNPGASSEPT
jgi:single-strand selective monofunctional uracil DNA glycosylase